MIQEKKYPFFSQQGLLWLTAILFLFLVLLLCIFNRLAADDFYFLYAQQQLGTLACVKYCYATFSGRWLAYSLTCDALQFANAPYFLLVFGILTVSFIGLAIGNLIHRTNELVGMNMKRNEIVLHSVLLLCTFFFVNFGIAETWFWYTSVCSYLLSLGAFIFLITELSKSKLNFSSFLILIVFPLFIGGASESFAVIGILALLFIFILSFSAHPKLRKLVKTNHRIKLGIALVLLTVSFTITALAPGNSIRLSMLPHPSVGSQVFAPFKAFVKVGFLTFKNQLVFLLLFSLPWFYLGYKQRETVLISWIDFIKKFKLIFIALLVLLFILILPSTLVLNETPPVRALEQFSFVLCFAAALLFFAAGKQVVVNSKRVEFLNRFSTWIMILFLLACIFKQYHLAGKYAERYDARMKVLIGSSLQTNAALLLDSLPPSGMLYSAEISVDSNFYSNQHLQHALQLSRGVAVKGMSIKEVK